MKKLRCKNWDEHQHYKKKNKNYSVEQPWFMMYGRKLLGERKFIELKPEESQPALTLAKSRANFSWVKIKKQVALKKPFFEHYLEKCKVPVFSEKEIQLSFSDQFTFDLVKTPENIELLKETIKALSGHEMDIRLTLDTANQDPDVPPKEKKKSINPETEIQKSETEIIQDALDIFGGIVIK